MIRRLTGGGTVCCQLEPDSANRMAVNEHFEGKVPDQTGSGGSGIARGDDSGSWSSSQGFERLVQHCAGVGHLRDLSYGLWHAPLRRYLIKLDDFDYLSRGRRTDCAVASSLHAARRARRAAVPR